MKQEFSTNDWNGYIMVDSCPDCTAVSKKTTPATLFTGTSFRQKNNKTFVISSKRTQHELESKRTSELTCLNGISRDVYLKCEDGTIFSAHRHILSAASPYFAAMFQSNMVEKSRAIIDIHGVESYPLKCLINFAYSTKLVVKTRNIFEILMSANMLCFEDVEQSCVEFLNTNLDLESCVDVLTIAEIISNETLYQNATIFIVNNFSQFSWHQSFNILTADQLEVLLANDDIDVTSEAEVFDALLTWVKFDSINRISYMPRLLRHVRLTLMSRKYLVDIVLRESLIMNEETTRNIVLEALDYYILPERTCSSQTAAPHSPRQVSNRNLYVVGGQVRQTSIRSGESYNFKTKSWTSLPNMNYPRNNACAVVLDGNLYVLGGINQNGDLSYVEKYNVVTKKWKMVASLKRCKGALSAVAIDGWIYAVGGSNGHKGALHHLEQYDPIADRWTILTDMRIGRSYFGVAELCGRLYAVGGYCGISEIKHCDCFDPTTKSWTEISPLNKPRMNHSVTSSQERLYAFGGKTSFGLVHTIEKYNPEINIWLVIKTNFEMRLGMNICSSKSRGSSSDQSVFVVGGLDPNEKETKQVTTISLKSPDFINKNFPSMLEERTFAAVALL